MKKFVSFIFLILLSCSKDSPTPIEQLTYALTVSASEGGSVDNTGGIHNENIESKCGWSPFNGFEFKGTPVSTIIAGKVKMQNGNILGDPEGTPLKFDI